MEVKGSDYKERCRFQLNEWVKGNSIHNDIDNECCPDFSCCNKEVKTDKIMRETFKAVCIKADEEGYNEKCHPYDDAKMGMLMGFLGASIATIHPKKKVYITDGNMSIKKELN